MTAVSNTMMTTMEKQMQKWLEGEVGRLATQYKFNKKEAMSYLRGEIERVATTAPAAEKKAPKAATKTVKKSDNPDLPQPDVPLPYCGEGDADQCCAVVLNHQMFTQCTHRWTGEFTTEGDGGATTLNLCKGCFRSAGTRTKAGNNALLYGAIAERLEKGGVIGNNGALRKPVTYANVMAKLSITEEQAVAAAEKLGWTIPDEELHPAPVARGRPKKAAVEVVVDTSDTGSDGEKTAAKKRGRPKKQKKVMSSAQGDDLIASLVEEAQQTGAAAATSDEEAATGSDTSAQSKDTSTEEEEKAAIAKCIGNGFVPTDEAKALKKQSAAEKKVAASAAKLARAAELAAKKEESATLAAAAKLGKQVAAEEKKAARLLAAAQKKEEKAAAAQEKKDAAAAKKKDKSAPPPPAADELVEEAEEDEEATQVVKWTCPADEKEYLKSADNVVYDAESHDAVGVWNEKENKIDELPAEEGDDEHGGWDAVHE